MSSKIEKLKNYIYFQKYFRSIIIVVFPPEQAIGVISYHEEPSLKGCLTSSNMKGDISALAGVAH